MPLVVAVDSPAQPSLVEELCKVADGIKVGLPAVLRAGLEWALDLARRAEPCRGLRILDFKLADIAPVMKSIVEPFLGSYDAFIAHSFVGARGALSDLKRFLDDSGSRLALVASMSHPGSVEVYDRALDYVERVIEEVDPWGLVAPATRPSVIRRLRSRFPGKVILAPGIGPQGASPGEALRAGADYEIVGRLVMGAPDPVRAARRILEEQGVLGGGG